MSFIQDRQNRWKTVAWWLLAILLIVLNGMVIHSTWNLYQKEKIAKSRLAESKERYNTAAADLALLEKTVKVLNTERGTEEIIRRHLGFMRPGEGVVTILEDKATNTSTTTPDQSWWSKVKNWLDL